MRFIFATVFVLSSVFMSLAKDDAGEKVRIVWLGISSGSHPAIEGRLSTRLDEMIRSEPGAEVVDVRETERLKHLFSFSEHPVMNADFAKALSTVANDRTLVIWGRITGWSEKIRRTWWIFGAEAQSDLEFSFSCYSLNYKEFVFLGDINSRVTRFQEPVFFRPAQEVVHLSASDRSEMDNSLIADVIHKCDQMVQGLCRVAVSGAGGASVTVDNMQKENATTASDIFDIPTIEAPSINIPPEMPVPVSP